MCDGGIQRKKADSKQRVTNLTLYQSTRYIDDERGGGKGGTCGYGVHHRFVNGRLADLVNPCEPSKLLHSISGPIPKTGICICISLDPSSMVLWVGDQIASFVVVQLKTVFWRTRGEEMM